MFLTQRLLLLTIALPFLSLSLHAQQTLKAPNAQAEPINQRRAYGNACGPASLLNAFQYGNEKWQKAYKAVPGTDSRSRINYVIGAWGNRPSKHIEGVKRWNVKQGINLLDLTDMANEMRSAHFLPKVKNEILTLKPKESRTELLQRSHARMSKSLKKGLPPIISLRRYAFRFNKDVGQKSWWPVRAHFVVVIEVPEALHPRAQSFKIRYVDPYGGYVRSGTINAATGQFSNSPFLSANLPQTSVGMAFVKAGEKTELSFSAIIGRW
ncbi:hypothetical protein NT6N_04800 [Oceaniferula spumae]|uniref:Peptidase C39-like domain-containing protein n=1 Tax=Oceaniferula spumae TaxID=2979115 RepID=A0AAT9FHK7_9BACT